MKPSKNFRTKIAVGYALIIVVCILSVGYVYRQVERFTGPDDSRMQVQSRRSLVNQTLYHLYQAEGYGQFLIAGYPSYERRYRDELQVGANTRFARCVGRRRKRLAATHPPGQHLVADRREGAEHAGFAAHDPFVGHGDAAELEHRTTPAAQHQVDTAIRQVVQQDTVSVPRRKRGFFRRLGDLFSPPKEDSSVVISAALVAPAVPRPGRRQGYHCAGAARLAGSRDQQRLEIYERAWNDGTRLKYSNEQINEKIYRLLMDFEDEDTGYLMRRMNERAEAFRRRSSLMLGGMPSGPWCSCCFRRDIWRDIGRSNRYKRELEEANRTTKRCWPHARS